MMVTEGHTKALSFWSQLYLSDNLPKSLGGGWGGFFKQNYGLLFLMEVMHWAPTDQTR